VAITQDFVIIYNLPSSTSVCISDYNPLALVFLGSLQADEMEKNS